MEVYTLQFGETPIGEFNLIALGANYRRLGYSKEQMFSRYSREVYPVEHFDNLEYGFDNDGKLDLPVRRMSEFNLDFLSDLLLSRKEIQGYLRAGSIALETRPADSGDSRCRYEDQLLVELKHPQYALVCLCSFRTCYPPDGQEYSYWSFDICAERDAAQNSTLFSWRASIKSLRHALWLRFQNKAFTLRACGASSRSATTVYDHFELSATGERHNPYTEEVAQAISVLKNLSTME
jgi:hypothetical protein